MQKISGLKHMNWYKKILIAQIWETNSDGSFDDELKALYELEYKLQALKNYKFKGLEQRRQNMIEKLEDELSGAINNVKEPLLKTFQSWLNAHALLNPQQWAQQRIDPEGTGFDDYANSIGEESFFQGIIDEYKRYKNNNQPWHDTYRTINWDAAFSEMIQEALQNEEKFPSLQKIRTLYALDNEEQLRNDLTDIGFAEFGKNMRGEPFNSEEEAETYIEEMANNFELVDYLSMSDMDSFIQSLSYAGVSLEQFALELNQNLVFPYWYRYWSDQGIDSTREMVEEAYNILQNANELNDNIAAINHALNTTHQTGEMVDHLQTYVPEMDSYDVVGLLEDLTNGKFIPQWNKELRVVGIIIPRSTIPK